jgi:hypothetical protein
MSPAAYHFLPWVARGAAGGAGAADDGGALPVRLQLDLAVEISGGAVAPTTMRVQGPGDVVGIDHNQIVRTEPIAGSTDFEPNFFPHVELAEVALPWLFTPAVADLATDHLRPWCVVVVVAAQDGVEVVPGKVLEVLEIRRPAVPRHELPDLAESWAWVHAQVVAEAGVSPEQGLAGDDRLSLARLLCPRRLDPLTSYHACLVPAFDAGVAAGLGEPFDQTTIGPAWRSGEQAPDEVRLPVYHHWQFATGPVGDFESLARRLQPRQLPDSVGRRPMYIGAAGSGMPQLAPDDERANLDLEGALRLLDQERAPMPDPPRAAVEAVLQRLADAGAARHDVDDPDTPPLGAPLYGAWPARHHTVGADTDPPLWLRALNIDPRDRVAAAAGVRAVQAHQEDLVHSAWEQLGTADTANQRLREMGLARAVAQSLHRRHLAPMEPAALVQLLGPAARRLRTGDRTLAAETRDSALADAAIQPRFRKALRPTTRVRRSGEIAATMRADAVHRLNDRAVQPKPERSAPDGALLARGMGRLRVDGATAVLPGADGVTVPAAFAPVLAQLATVDPRRPRPDPQLPQQPTGFALVREVDVLALIAVGASGVVTSQGQTRLSVGEPSVRRLPVVALRQDVFDSLLRARVRVGLPVDLRVGGPVIRDPLAPRRYQRAVERGVRRLFVTVDPDPVADPLALAGVAATALDVTEPARRAALRAAARVVMPGGIDRPADPLAPIRGAPVFPVPLVELIGAIDREYVLPGLQLVEANTVGLVEANRRFVEAALVGANHEMARELEWRLYPVERRASFFRRFWNRPPGTFDVPAIGEWATDAGLGQNAFGSLDGELILIIRGDLLRRYPGTIIYAAEAEFVDGHRVLVDPPVEVHPVLTASLPPDVTMRGFNLGVDEVVGDDTRPGWFFVIASQPTEPRFGLDVAVADSAAPTNRKDLNWAHMAPGGDLGSVTHATVGALANPVLGPLTWGRDAAQQAAITLQDPVRIVIHARHLLGPLHV